jgi:hypothetical protein
MGDLPTYLVSGDPDVKWPGEDPKDYNIVPLMSVDEHTLDVFGMHLLVGRYFSKAYGSDDSAVVLNEAALKLMHMTPATAVGKTIRFNDRPYSVVGGIVRLLAREFLLPVLLATLIAFPVAGWAMSKWLHGFAFRIGVEWL